MQASNNKAHKALLWGRRRAQQLPLFCAVSHIDVCSATTEQRADPGGGRAMIYMNLCLVTLAQLMRVSCMHACD